MVASILEPVALKWHKSLYLQAVEAGVFDGRHVEFIEGEILEMSPMGNPHDVAVDLVEEALRFVFPRNQFTIRIQKGFDAEGDSMPEPDLAVVRGRPRDYLAGKPRQAELIVEVSESSLRFDRRVKASLYARSAIPEYWIVNLIDGTLEVYRTPASSEPHAYASISVYRPGDTIAPVGAPDASVAVTDLMP